MQMQIELEDYQNGKPLILNASNQVITKIKNLKQLKKYREISQFTQSLPCHKQKYLIKANALLHLKEWKDLIKCCDRGLELSEESQFYNLKGKALGKMGDQQAKVKLLEIAIEINNKVPAYHRNLGAAYYALKNYQKAMEEHSIAIKLEPGNAINYHNTGAALFRRGDFEEAKKLFQKAIQKDKNLSLSYSWEGDCEKELKNYEKAVELYQKAYDISGNVVYIKEKEKIQKQFNVNQKKKKFLGLF